MKKILPFILLAGIGFLSYSCDRSDDVVVQNPGTDSDTVPLMKDLTGTFTAADKYVLNADISIEKTDVVLVYRRVGNAWQQIPKTVYVDPSNSASPRKFDYNFVFDNNLVQVRIDDANFNLGSMSPAEVSNYLTNQTFRIVLVFANAGKSAGKSAAKANIDYSDYNAVAKYYNLDESKVQTVNVK